MPKITSYGYITDIVDGTVFLTDGPNGTKQLQGLDAPYAIMGRSANKASAHRSVFRGKSLGSSITATQRNAIANGTFSDIWVGDYWTIGGIKYRIADLDYFPVGTATSSGAINGHHAVIIPDCPVGIGNMSSASSYPMAGGSANAFASTHVYYSLTTNATNNYGSCPTTGTNISTLRTYLAGKIGTTYLKTRYSYQVTGITDGYPSARAYKSGYFDIPNELMVYGCHIYAPASNGTITPSLYTTEPRQLALFQLAPEFIIAATSPTLYYKTSSSSSSVTSTTTNIYWLKDITGAAYAIVDSNGRINTKATSSGGSGIRPFFCIG